MDKSLVPLIAIALIAFFASACSVNVTKPDYKTTEHLKAPVETPQVVAQAVPQMSNPVCGECQYLNDSTCVSYACCEDSMCEDDNSYTSDTCISPKTPEARCEHHSFCSKGIQDWETAEGECSKFKPFYCDTTTKELALKCSICGCNDGYICKNDGNCYIANPCVSCPKNKECNGVKCMLKESPYKLGLVYVYYDEDTYNPNWRAAFGAIIPKVENGIKQLTDSKVDASIEILGEVHTNRFCWNPATLGFSYKTQDYTFASGEVVPGQIVDEILPGSQFNNPEIRVSGKVVSNNCKNCKIEESDSGLTTVSISCENPLSYDNLFVSNKLDLLNSDISYALGKNLSTYDGIYIVFGKLGTLLPDSTKNLRYRCTTVGGFIGGYSSLIMAENSMLAGGQVDCSQLGGGLLDTYDKAGWQTMVHEIMHRFGAVDTYDTATTFGIVSERQKALEIDPHADESIMGNNAKACIDEGGWEQDGNVCTMNDLEKLYLDKYNRQNIGLE